MKWPRDTDAELKAFYGDPGTTQRERVIWESANLVYVPIPWKAYRAWDLTKPSVAVRVHRKIQIPVDLALHDVWVNVAKASQEEIEKLGMHKVGGAHIYRLIRNGTRFSTHTFGCAIDWNPDQNQMGAKGNMDPRVRACFERQGAIWLRHDPMHCQWADSPKAMPRVALPWTAKPPPGVKYIEKHISKPELSSSIDKPVSVQPVHTGMAEWVKISQPSIEGFEDFRAEPYWDFGQWSHGFGLKCEKNTPPITREQARQMLTAYLTDLARKIAPLIKVKVTPNQGAALLSFTYNVGLTNFAKSSVLVFLNSADALGAAQRLLLWDKATINGVRKSLPGLKNRRAAEKKLFLTP